MHGCPSPSGRWRAGEFAAREDDGDMYDRAVQLGFVHVCDRVFGAFSVFVDYVGGSAVGHDFCSVSASEDCLGGGGGGYIVCSWVVLVL